MGYRPGGVNPKRMRRRRAAAFRRLWHATKGGYKPPFSSRAILRDGPFVSLSRQRMSPVWLSMQALRANTAVLPLLACPAFFGALGREAVFRTVTASGQQVSLAADVRAELCRAAPWKPRRSGPVPIQFGSHPTGTDAGDSGIRIAVTQRSGAPSACAFYRYGLARRLPPRRSVRAIWLLGVTYLRG